MRVGAANEFIRLISLIKKREISGRQYWLISARSIFLVLVSLETVINTLLNTYNISRWLVIGLFLFCFFYCTRLRLAQ